MLLVLVEVVVPKGLRSGLEKKRKRACLTVVLGDRSFFFLFFSSILFGFLFFVFCFLFLVVPPPFLPREMEWEIIKQRGGGGGHWLLW